MCVLSLPSMTHLMKKINRFPFRFPVLQIASTPLKIVFNSRSIKMAKKESGENHRITFPHCRWIRTRLDSAVFTHPRNWTSYKAENWSRNDGRTNLTWGHTVFGFSGGVCCNENERLCLLHFNLLLMVLYQYCMSFFTYNLSEAWVEH